MQDRIEELLKQLTLDEKIGMIHGDGLFRTKGVERLNIPPLTMSDGPMGVRHEFENAHWIPDGHNDDFVTYLPCNSALASTWNRDLAYESGRVLGEEARGRGKDVILAPGVNIKRSPLCGRNFEYMSEDPYLTGEMAVPIIKGIQENDTAACVKHFAMNNQETRRLEVEAVVSERAMREIYLPAFDKAVHEGGSLSLMGAYNLYKGEYCCQSKYLQNRILREEWQYDGMVVSDWGAVHDTVPACESGLDIEMSVFDNFDDYCLAQPLKKAVEEGRVDERLIDEKVRHILLLLHRLHKLDGRRMKGAYNTPQHRQTVLEAARESVILLKNDKGLLPLDPDQVHRLLVVGDNASRIHSAGGGSAEIKALYEITPLMGIKKLLGGNAEVVFARGYEADDCDVQEREVNWQADSLDTENSADKDHQSCGSAAADAGTAAEAADAKNRRTQLREEAVRLAAEGGFDQVLFIGGLNHQHDLEGQDRADMKLPYGQDQVLTELLKARPDTAVVIMAGSPVEMDEWIGEAGTLVYSWYNGMEGGTALAEILFGLVNPSGRLPESFPHTHKDCSAHCIGEFPGGDTVAYTEDIFVGYRYYDTKEIQVVYPFGYGLSYTEFAYDGLQIGCVEKGSSSVQISVDITNTGSRSGKEVVQLYIGKADAVVARARKELKGFEKITLQAGETGTVTFKIRKEELAYYDEDSKAFVTEPGEYQIYVGRSVADIRLQGSCLI